MKIWKTINKSKIKNQISVGRGQGKAKIEKIIKILLENRGIRNKKEIKNFFESDVSKISLKNAGINAKEINKAVKRINFAVAHNETILIYGDYDTDGICATAILWETIYREYKNVFPYIPHRKEEGYGLSDKGLENVLKEYPKTKLIITVDNGIVANKAIDFAQKKGIEVIITDHHQKGRKQPRALAIIHTQKLCGAGVAYLLSQEISNCKFQISNKSKKQNSRSKIPMSPMDKVDSHLDLVALATVADLVPLLGLNRTLVIKGIEVLRKTERPGLKALIEEAGLEKDKIGVYEIGHIIAPRLNAMGRLSHAMDSLRLLCTNDHQKAHDLARKLGATNRERQNITLETTFHAKSLYQDLSSSKIIFVSHEEYDEGVIGLVASRLAEEYHRPAFVVSLGEKHSKGSARSIKGVNIIEMIRSVSDFIIEAGGHPMAAGFTIETAKIKQFGKALEKRASETISDDLLQKKVNIDLELDFKRITHDLYREIEKFEPFGVGNPEPVFLTKNVVVSDFRLVGMDGKHLKLRVKSQDSGINNEINVDAIAFGMGERATEINIGSKIDVVYSIKEDEWNGYSKLQLKIRDLRVSETKN